MRVKESYNKRKNIPLFPVPSTKGIKMERRGSRKVNSAYPDLNMRLQYSLPLDIYIRAWLKEDRETVPSLFRKPMQLAYYCTTVLKLYGQAPLFVAKSTVDTSLSILYRHRYQAGLVQPTKSSLWHSHQSDDHMTTASIMNSLPLCPY